ncbi:unnamed protein product [Blepharisma stoltei]|uniref:Uncharacterized protein n=1 Tax=Blepharisma stoltei TaxID=1481888 RepID=A0AAU9JGM0_9CILI|nr:unnamed protein product [Blepharisma stoltei]
MKPKSMAMTFQPDLKEWKHTMVHHHKKLKEIKELKSSIDCSSPKYFPHLNHINSARVLTSRENERIYEDNIRILRNLTSISSSTARTQPPKKYNSSNFQYRLWNQVKILQENLHISHRLKNATNSVDFKSYEKDYQKHLKYRESILKSRERRYKIIARKKSLEPKPAVIDDHAYQFKTFDGTYPHEDLNFQRFY